MNIRAVELKDAEAISLIRRQSGVRENILAPTSERLETVRGFISSLKERDIALVAEEDSSIKGFACAIAEKSPRRSHSAFIAVMVDRYFQRTGVGKKLLKRLIEEADKAKLHRLELYVFTDNEAAISLYKKMGFETEALRKKSAVRNGELTDEFLMARISGRCA